MMSQEPTAKENFINNSRKYQEYKELEILAVELDDQEMVGEAKSQMMILARMIEMSANAMKASGVISKPGDLQAILDASN